ncbi:carbamoyltransferase C-terminal domain-containing protein [Dactylosporangium sp. NPDC051484]|uniref:carbamoyltransferase C-terminal domain-containing protein n=1 Tax=Dactylosporangium sp. NPDC051484 TaxID=3154942 RepID=UPI00344E216F
MYSSLPTSTFSPVSSRASCTRASWAATLDRNRIRYREHGDDIADVTAELLAEGHIVGWFQGAAETGPRALGHRSILADPRDPAARDRINRDVKHRELWRPLAPSIHADALARYVRDPGPAEFMIVAYPATDEAAATIPATVHVDDTLRPQAVDGRANPRYARLLTTFGELTGIPAVLNTSFNHEAEPIVCTPADALRTFASTPLDALAIGGFLVTKEGDPPPHPRPTQPVRR